MPKYGMVCEEVVREAGRVVQDLVECADVRKKGPSDLVTSADLAAQEVICGIVLKAFPDHAIIGEEDLKIPAKEGAMFRWIVDPLDGTTNYVHRVPHYSISLALEHDGQLVTGAVYDPNREECFTATVGEGAFLNGDPIRTSSVTQLSESLAAVGFPYDLNSQSPDLLVFLAMAPLCQAIRRTGSAALNLCYVAAGRFDLFWSFSTHIWDVAAGVLIIREAGGVVTSPTGGEFVLDEAHFLAAANARVNDELVDIAARALDTEN